MKEIQEECSSKVMRERMEKGQSVGVLDAFSDRSGNIY